MIWSEAIDSAKEGNFLSNNNFDDKQSMHCYDGYLFYEDGSVLSGSLVNIMYDEEWSKDGWFIKYTKDKVNQNKLKEIHEEFKNRMLTMEKTYRSYEECII